MDYQKSASLQKFKSHIGVPFQLYNSLFTSLPFHKIEKTGILLSLFLENCSEGFERNQSPTNIVDHFFEKHTTYKDLTERLDLLFRFVQYVERQIVLFDALEDAAFKSVNDVNGAGTLKYLEAEVLQNKAETKLATKLKDFAVRIVLTAHPTQFYPGPVLGIIHDLSRALKENEAEKVDKYLQQLGKTAFLNKTKPTPYDEAISLVWFLEHVFYAATGNVISFLKTVFAGSVSEKNPMISLRFWPGGDRDGNPNVNTEITLRVAAALRSSIIKCYYRDVSLMKRRLTFKGVEQLLAGLETQLYQHIYQQDQTVPLSCEKILDVLHEVKEIVNRDHGGLFISLVEDLISKVQAFGLYFASLDIRQESSIHQDVLEAIRKSTELLPPQYATASMESKMDMLSQLEGIADIKQYDGITRDTLLSMSAVKIIQEQNGERGCHRYVISQCNSALNVMEVYGLFLLSGWKKGSLDVDIVPLFETVEDLKQAPGIMETLFTHKAYLGHLKYRNNTQTIMVGFSDGTKDGGYLMANWSIYAAKKALTAMGRKHNIDIIFFDGRGGPPARGAGKTHKFYASMGKEISNKEIQLTVQGQTISSAFGTKAAARFNIEQLLTAGITNDLFPGKDQSLKEKGESLFREMAEISLEKYLGLKNNPRLLDYLMSISPIKYYGETNIASRPSKRNTGGIVLKDLRAIPYVGAWSQVKQNVTGYYGVGTALKHLESEGKWDELVHLYQHSLFLKTLFDNCEMSMKKCFFPLTAVLAHDAEYSELWTDIYDEFELSKAYLLKLSGQEELMADYPVEQLSITIREKIVLPLVTIQQYALATLRKTKDSEFEALKTSYEKLVIRCSFGIINAGRNSV